MSADSATPFESAVTLHRAGKIAEAEAACRAILADEADHPRALHMLGAIRHAQGAVDEALDLLGRAVRAKPDYAEAQFNLGAMLTAARRYDEAIAHYRQAAILRPEQVETHRRLAALLMDLERRTEAEAAFRQVVALAPNDGLALADLSTLTLAQGRTDDAVAFGRRAVAQAPDLGIAHLRLGRALKERGDYEEAIDCYRRALALEPGSPRATNFLAVALYELGRLDEAETLCRELLAREPDNAPGHCNLAVVLQGRGDAAGALASYRRASDLAPQDVDYHRCLLATVVYSADLSPEQRYAEHLAFGRTMAARVKQKLQPRWSAPGAKLRIGWLSSDFRDHPVGRNLQLLFARRGNVATWICYGDIRRPDDMTAWFQSRADGWRLITGVDDAAVAAMIAEDGIDVMIYLAGRFDYNRPQIAAWRPAPVQVSFHDPATSGLAEMDYLLADPMLAPPRGPEKFTERVAYLPSFYTHAPVEGAPPVADLPLRGNGYVTFGSFNNPTKLTDGMLNLWADVLHAVPGSRLMLKYKNRFAQPGVQSRVARAPTARGIDPARVWMGGDNDDGADHLALYGKIDIALDSFPFTGSTTTFEALWMGVPVVTLAGPSMVARWSASILHRLGLDDLIATTPDAYVATAVALAGDAPRLAGLRAGLRDRIAASPLCNGAARGRQLDRLLRALWCHSRGRGGTASHGSGKNSNHNFNR